ncbi:MAG TPA: ComEC/Rec2 family competence protein [Candidatus Limnocylindrales bacterium]|nr:ComEC/Rec2 family competence protein [Candidatus Limnocylindrales bacterium]
MPASGWLAIGSVAAGLASGLVAPLVIALAAAAAAVAGLSLRAVAASPRRLGLIGLGALVLALRIAGSAAPHRPAAELPAGNGPWEARVESVGSVRDGSQVATLRIDAARLRVAATLPRFPAIEPGMAITVGGSLRPPPDDGYGAYLERIGVAATLRSRALEIRPSKADAAVVLERLRRGAATALAAAIPEPAAGLASGIVVGLRDRVDRDLAADFTTVGASHVVAISGWNIAIVAASIAAVLGSLARRPRSIVTIVAIVAYVLFAGASASVVRAAAMAAVVLLARESGRSGRAAAALGWAAVLLLLVDPALVSDAGFQLSALATAGILAWASPLTKRLGALLPARTPGWLVECLGVSLAAQVATLPVVLLSFGRLAIISPALNLLVVPLVAPAMAASAVALGGGLATMAGAPGLVATLLGLPAWFLLSLIVGIVEAGAALPFASATLEPPWNAVGAIAAAVTPFGVIAARRRRLRPRRGSDPAAATPAGRHRAVRRVEKRPRRAVIIALAISVVAVGVAAVHRPDGTTRITVLDVGQGDAILVEGSRGGRLLVDGGPDPDRLLIELDRRLPPWDRRLDAVVLTHPHEDHVAGLALLLSRYRVGRVFEPGMRGPGPGYAEWDALLGAAGAPPRGHLATGDRLAVDDLRFDVLWPDPGHVPSEPADSGRAINDVSIVLLGEVDGRRVLLTGDVEDDVDSILAERGLPPIDFLKVAHHGSGTASTVAFLGAVRPSVAVVSAGADNPYGHPARTTLEHLRDTGAEVLRTDTDGTVEVAIEGGRMTVRASGPRATTRTAPISRSGSLAGLRAALPAAVFSCAVPSSG